jgi:hypothetical protein
MTLGTSHMPTNNLNSYMGANHEDMTTTPSPPTPDIVTPEFDLKTGQLQSLKDNKAWPKLVRSGPNWVRSTPVDNDLSEAQVEEDEEDRPLRHRPSRRDKGKGKAVEATPVPSRSPSPELVTNEGFDLEKAISMYGIEVAEELQVQYVLEISRLRTQLAGNEAVRIACADSPGASGSGTPAQKASMAEDWDDDAEGEVDMSRWSPDDEDDMDDGDDNMDAEDEEETFTTPTATASTVDKKGTPTTVRVSPLAALALRAATFARSNEIVYEPEIVARAAPSGPYKFPRSSSSKQVSHLERSGDSGDDF